MNKYPLLQSQMGVFAECVKYPRMAGYNLPYIAALPDDIDMRRLAGAWKKIISAHPVLRNRYEITDGGEVLQYPDPDMDIPVIFRVSSDSQLHDYVKNGFIRPFDLLSGEPLVRVELVATEKGKYQLVDMHHTICDGMTMINLINKKELPDVYAGKEPYHEEVTLYDAALKEKETFGTEEYRRVKEYYARIFSENDFATISENLSEEPSPMIREQNYVDRAAIDEWCEKHGTATHHFFRAVFVHTFALLTRHKKVGYYSSHAGRSRETMDTFGMFVKSVPLLTEIRNDMTAVEFVKSMNAGAKLHLSVYPFTHFCADFKKEPKISFNFMGNDTFAEYAELNGERFRCGVSVRGDTNADLSVHIYLDGDRYEVRLESGEAFNNREALKMVSRALLTLIDKMLACPETKMSEFSLVSEEEREALITLSKGEILPYDTSKTWLSLFAEKAKEIPSNIAVKDHVSEFTYRELDECTDRLASYLAGVGIAKGDFVAVKLPRGKEFIAAVMAIHKTGAAYVPVDPEYPADRIEYMTNDCGAKLMIESLAFNADGIFVNGQPAKIPDDTELSSPTPDDLAYMIYTSGSTGKPKGAMLTHRGLMNFTVATAAQNELISADRVASHRSFSFDAHIEDVFPVLASGAAVFIMPEEIRKDLDGIAEFLETNSITGCGFTTSLAKLLLQNYDLGVRYMTAGGEALTNICSEKVQVINEYGPTECTNDSCVYKLEKGRVYGNIPIGRPMPNSYCFVVDMNGHLLPQGASGELCYAGPQTGRGYWKLEEKTKEVFEPCPFADGLMMYHTGDLAKWNSEGLLMCLGRIDHQVKLRGYRIEMGEIENHALETDGVAEAAAAVKEYGGSPHLVLYYAAKEGSSVSDMKVREHIEDSSLAVYMRPEAYVRLDALPKLPNGKIDRRSLPEPEINGRAQYIAPETENEKLIADAMKTVLGLDGDIGALDNFFDLGGDSIKAIRMISVLRSHGLKLSVPDVMSLRVVRPMAAQCVYAGHVTRERPPFSGSVGQTPIFAYFIDCGYEKPNHFNQANLYRLSSKADMNALKRAWKAVTDHHDMLRAVYSGGEVIVRDTSAVIEIEKISVLSRGEITDKCRLIQSGISMENALARVCLFGTESEDYFFICAHHFIIDGVSWRILLEDLESAYSQALSLKPSIALPSRTDSYKVYADAMSDFEGSYKLSLERAYWDNTDKKLRSFKSRELREGAGEYEHITVCLDASATRRVFSAKLSALNLEINDLLISAVCEAFYDVSGDGSVSVQMEGHGREDIGADIFTDRTIGWFTSVYPVVFSGISGDIRRDLPNIKEEIHRIPSKGVGYLALRKGDSDRKAPWISFNYLGETDAEKSGSRHFIQQSEISPGEIWAQENYEGPALQMNSYIQNGVFTLTLDYDRREYTRAQAETYVKKLFDRLSETAEYLATAENTVTPSDLGETQWSREEFEAVLSDFARRGETVERIIPLSGMQEAMLLKNISEPESFAYRLVFIYETDVSPTEKQLRRALDRLAVKHEVLRSAIVYENVSVHRQVITDRMPSLTMVDISRSPSPESIVLSMREGLLKNAFDLQKKPLFGVVCAKAGGGKCYILTISHHIIQDGWSMQIYMNDFKTFLKQELDGVEYHIEKITDGSYERAIRELAQKDRKIALSYWAELLSDYDICAVIPSCGIVAEQDRSRDELSIEIDAKNTEAFSALCRDSQATISNGIELAWGLVLSVCMRNEDVVFAKVVSGRDNTETDVSRTVGLFINSVPVRVKTDKDTTARQALGELQKQSARSAQYDYCALSEIMGVSELGTDLLSTVLAFENYSGGMESGGEDDLKLTGYCMKEEAFDAVNPVTFIDESGRLVLHIGFDPAKYTVREIRAVLELFRNFIEGMVSFPDVPIHTLPRLDAGHRREVAVISRGKELVYDKTQTFIDLFARCAEKYPDNTAVVDENGSYTYGELNDISDRIAASLIRDGVRGERFVAVKIGRSKEFPAAVIGVMKAGAAYVPVDPSYPKDRIEYMLEDCEAKVVLTEESVQKALSEDCGADVDISKSHPSPDSLAYMIYTSGSTGKPKGVMLSHRALRAFLAWRKELVGLSEKSIHAQHASFSFDASLDDLICPLAFGGQVHILSDGLRKSLPDMNRYFIENHVTGLTLSTQMGMAMIEQFPDNELEFLMMGGEKMLPSKNTSTRLINGYGPTEFTVCSSYHIVDQEKDREIPIGRAVPNTWSFVCDKYGHLLPQGFAGELCLMGDQLAEGYWRREELTDERFVSLPEINEACHTDLKVYRTGDVVRYNRDGELEYLGRADDQVKLRGYRIEMGEIEGTAASFEGVIHACAKVVSIGDTKTLCLYYTADRKIGSDELREYLAGSLAEYMVPGVFMQLDSMPLTPNGKVNKRALPVPTLQSSADYVAPANEKEEKIARAMKEILNISGEVGALDNFFELGGDSIKAIRMTSLLRSEDIILQVWDVMKHKTVRKMSLCASEAVQNVKTSQEPFTGHVEASPIIRFFDDLNLPQPQYFHQSVLLKCRERVDISALEKALGALAYQHDLLRACVERNDNGEITLSVRSVDDARIKADEIDLMSDSDFENTVTAVCGEIKRNFDLSVSLFKTRIFHTPDADMLFMCAHHLIIDGVSWRILTADIEEAYDMALRGCEIRLPDKTDTYSDYVEAVKQYAQSSALRREVPYWQQVEREMLSMPVSAGKDHKRQFRTAVYRRDRDFTGKILRAPASRFNADINDYLICALAQSYADCSGTDSLSLQLEGHGREQISETFAPDRTVGWFTSVYPVALKNISGDIRRDMVTVKETLHRIPNKGVGYNILRYMQNDIAFEKDRWAQVGFNYLGEMDSEARSDSFFTRENGIGTASDISEENLFGPDMMLNCFVMDHSFEVSLQYNAEVWSDSRADAFAKGFFKALDRIADYMDNMDENVVTASDLGETEWTQEEFESVIRDFAERNESLSRIYPLTSMQEGLLLKYLAEPDNWAYRLVTIFRMNTLPSYRQLTGALDKVLDKYEVLRSAIIYDGVSAFRQAITDRDACVHMADLSGGDDPVQAVLRLREDILTNGFDLQRKPLLQLTCAKISDSECFLIVAIHHIIVDGWCIPLYIGDFKLFLEEELTGRVCAPQQLPEKGLYEAAVREITEKDNEEALAYWDELLDGYEKAAAIPSYGLEPSEFSADDISRICVPAEITEKLTAMCQSEQVTLGNAVELLWALVLSTAARTDDVVFAKVVSGRDSLGVDVSGVVGLFINSIPVRVRLDGQTTIIEVLRALQEQASVSNRYDYCSISDIVKRTPLGDQLFQSVFAFENYSSGTQRDSGDLSFDMELFFGKEENIDMLTPSASVNEKGELCLQIVFDRTSYRKAEMDRIVKLFAVFAEAVAGDPHMLISEIPKLDENERREIMKLSKGETIDYDVSETWLSAFLRRVSEQPDAVAAVDRDGQLTYMELDDASDRIAAALIDDGVVPDDFVAVKMGRTKEFIAAVVGIHKVGAAYVPVDMDYPEQRVAYMLEDCSAKCVLTQELIDKILSERTAPKQVCLAKPEGLAYMIYTSGSTGKPKGAMITQRGLMNFTVATAIQNGLTPKDRVASHRSFSFDAHIEDVFPVLSSGASIHIMPEEIRKDADSIYAFLREHEITGCGFTTSVAKMLLSEYELGVRYITVGGEALSSVTRGKVQIINEYGPTECTNDICVYKLKRGRTYKNVPIGRPIANSFCFVTDQHGQLLPRGIAGELCYVGPQTGRGYWNRDELTKKSFVDCPFIEGTVMYRTGDLARYNEDGLIECLGRIDAQIKLRGFRIELEEIEENARRCKGVMLAAAAVKEISGAPHLILYYMPKEGVTVTEHVMRSHLENSPLASYMYPEIYVNLEEMPRLPNGKIDRKSLPEVSAELEVENVKPETAIEAHFLNAAKEILGQTEFGVTDDLFTLGMTSLSAMKFIVRINSMDFHQKFRVSDVMRYRDIRSMINGNCRIYWQYSAYDPEKPYLVFMYGIAPVAKTLQMLSAWSERFNILVIEAIDAHYDLLFDDKTVFDEVVDMYSLILENNIPSEARLAGLVGFSWGGMLAYRLADSMEDFRGERPFVMLGDSYFINQTDEGRQDELSPDAYPDNLFELTGGAITKHEVIRKMNISIRLDNTVTSIPKYDGKVILLNAHLHADPVRKKKNIKMIQELASDLVIIDFPKHSHDDLFFDQEQVRYYFEIMLRAADDNE